MTAQIERRLEALERHSGRDWRTAGELSNAELQRILIEALGYLPDDDELKRIATTEGADHDAT
jgi:hypothetical protein